MDWVSEDSSSDDNSYDNSYDNSSDGAAAADYSGNTTIIATALVIVSCAPILFVILIYLLNMCKSACQSTATRNENESNNLRATIISNMLREDNQSFVFRRAVLEKFFSDVSKSLTAKDFLSGSPFKSLSSFGSTPSDDFKKASEDGSKTGSDSDIEENAKLETPGTPVTSEDGSKTGSESDIEENAKPETPGTPSTDDNSDFDSSDDNSGHDHQEQERDPIVRRSLFPISASNNDGPEMLVITPLVKCDIISNEREEAAICNATDALERGAQDENNGMENVCPICLDSWDEGDTIIESKHCSHAFHKSCILLWLEQNDQCPCCRAQMISEEEIRVTALSVVGTQRMFSVLNEYSMQHSI